MSDFFRLLKLIRPYWLWLILGVVISLITLLANVFLMATSGWFIASMAIAGAAAVSMNYFTPAGIIRACAMTRTAGRYAERLVTHDATLRLLSRLRVWFYERIEPLAPARLQQYRAGDLLSRIRADIDSLDNFYLRILLPVAVALLASLLFFILLFRYSPLLAFIETGFFLLAGVVVPVLIARVSKAPGQRMVETRSELRAAVVDGVQGLEEITLFGATTSHADQIDALGHRLITDQASIARYRGLSQGAIMLCANLAMWLVMISVVPLVNSGKVPPAELAMLALFVLASFEAIAPLPLAFLTLGETMAAARRIFSIVDAQPAVGEPEHPRDEPSAFDLSIRGLSFTYPNTAKPALNAFDLDLSQGRKVAVIGSTGSGKTTLMNLLLRFWTADSGDIEFGGHSITDYRADTVRKQIAVVSQHTHLFNTTIRQNLLLAKPDATLTQLEAACKTAQIHSFISQQPRGYDTEVGEEALKVSGGEARRIAVARAILKDAPVLILDEPTEGLDAPTERSMLEAIHQLMEHKTVLLITHSLKGLEQMDEIVVMEEGRVKERGRHEQLLAKKSHYYQIYRHMGERREFI